MQAVVQTQEHSWTLTDLRFSYRIVETQIVENALVRHAWNAYNNYIFFYPTNIAVL